MTHLLPSRWPKLCDYEDSWRIVSHWPRAQGMVWSLPPSINVFFWNNDIDADEYHHWEFGQRLYDNSGSTWRYKKTTWKLWGRQFTFDIWAHSVHRDWGWEFSMQTFGYDHKDRLVSLGETRLPYATPGTQQYPPWIEWNFIDGRPIGHPYMHTFAYILPSSLGGMWSEVPKWLPDRA